MITLKISLGEKGNKSLIVPENVEPAKNIVKLAIFSMLSERIKDAGCLDLFAGSGNLGFTALSLGAKECTFVDDSKNSINCIKQNSENLDYKDKVVLIEKDIKTFLSEVSATKYDIIFADPPYKLTIDNIAEKLLNCISEEGVVIYLHHKSTRVEFEGFRVYKQKVYGKTKVSVLEKSEIKS